MKKQLNLQKAFLSFLALLSVFTLLVILWSNATPEKTGLDIYKSPPLIKLFWNNAFDYSRIQSEKVTYSADEPITLHVSFGFYLPEEGTRGSDTLTFMIEDSYGDYFDITSSLGTFEKCPGNHEDADKCPCYWFARNDGAYYFQTHDFDYRKLILKRGFLGQINKESLQYHYDITLQLKPDAPEEFSTTFDIHMHDGRSGDAYHTIVLDKKGDIITISGW